MLVVKSFFPRSIPGWLERTSFCLLYVNAACNWIIYCCMNGQVRIALWNIYEKELGSKLSSLSGSMVSLSSKVSDTMSSMMVLNNTNTTTAHNNIPQPSNTTRYCFTCCVRGPSSDGPGEEMTDIVDIHCIQSHVTSDWWNDLLSRPVSEQWTWKILKQSRGGLEVNFCSGERAQGTRQFITITKFIWLF